MAVHGTVAISGRAYPRYMQRPGRSFGRLLHRMVLHRDLDLYVLAAGALVFTVLGSAGLADAAALSSATLGLLTFLAIAQIRSRRQVGEIGGLGRVTRTDVLSTDFPDDLGVRRQHARTLLLIGHSLRRTVETSRGHLRRSLDAGAQIRVLLVDPDDENAVRTLAGADADEQTVTRLRGRINASLEEFASIAAHGSGRLELRVTSTPPHVGVNAVDVAGKDGLLVVQHYEHAAPAESAPILRLEPADGFWFQHFVAEAERMWRDGQPWPPSPERRLARATRATFLEAFGPERLEVLDRARHILVTGVTRSVLMQTEYGRFERWLRAGVRVRFLLFDPESPAILAVIHRSYSHRSLDTLRMRSAHTVDLLRTLKKTTGGDLEIRLTPYPLSLSVIAVDSTPETSSPHTAAFAEYYTFQVDGDLRFVVRPTDGPWYQRLIQETDSLWQQARPVPWTTQETADPTR